MNAHPSTAGPSAPNGAALPGDDHRLGAPHALLNLLAYGDYESPACIHAEPLVQRLVDTHRGRLSLVFRHFPLLDEHPHAGLAAEAAEAAAAQGRFWPMHHLLMAQAHQLKPAALDGCAQAIGLDMTRFRAEMADHLYTQRVQEHRRAGVRSGVRGLPAFFLNGHAVDATDGFERLAAAVHAGLQSG